jgi:hypothetical protein
VALFPSDSETTPFRHQFHESSTRSPKSSSTRYSSAARINYQQIRTMKTKREINICALSLIVLGLTAAGSARLRPRCRIRFLAQNL